MADDFLEWPGEQVQAQDKSVLVLIWDHASWHGRTLVRAWLPTRVAFIKRIGSKRVHGKRAIGESARLLPASELRQRACDSFGGEPADLSTQKVS